MASIDTASIALRIIAAFQVLPPVLDTQQSIIVLVFGR